MEKVDLCEIIRHDSDIDQARENWLSRVMGIVNDKVQTVTIKDQSGPLWIDSEVGHKVKHTAWSELSEQIKVVIGQHLQKIETNIKTKHKAFMTCMSDAVRKNPGKNPKRFGRYFK